MLHQLINVSHTNGTQEAFSLDTSATLETIRQLLAGEGLMAPTDVFLNATVRVNPKQEANISLAQLLKDGETLRIGNPSQQVLEGQSGVDRYNALTATQKKALLYELQIYRGLTFDNEEGFHQTFRDLCSWRDPAYLPQANQPRINTRVSTDYSFTKVTHEMKLLNSSTVSANLDVSFASAESEYSYAKSKIDRSEKVTEYLLSRYVIEKTSLQVDPSLLVAHPTFIQAIEKAVDTKAPASTKCYRLVETLNEWGYYVPLHFTLGGCLYSEETTQINDLNEAETEKKDFSVSFKAAFEKIGGGAAYKEGSESSVSTSTSTKYKKTFLRQIGGTPGHTDDYRGWANSLAKATSWGVVGIEKMYPSLMLLLHTQDIDKDAELLGNCLRLLDEYQSLSIVKGIQPYLNLLHYATAIEAMNNPFA